MNIISEEQPQFPQETFNIVDVHKMEVVRRYLIDIMFKVEDKGGKLDELVSNALLASYALREAIEKSLDIKHEEDF